MRARGFGCPYCSGRKVSSEHNLAVKFPLIAAEWHPIKNAPLQPHDVLPGIAKKVWWICQRGHEWQATINSRANPQRRGCPECGRANQGVAYQNAVIRKRGSLADTLPELVAEWNRERNGDLTPANVSSGSNQKVWWKCRFGHEWQARVANRKHGRACPFCRSNTSRLEVRIYTELRALFHDTRWQEKLRGDEADVFLPEISLIVELDGYPWHEGKEDFDKAKSTRFVKLGYTVIRLRDKKLKSIWTPEIFIDQRTDSHATCLRRLMEFLLSHCHLSDHQRRLVGEYKSRGVFVAEKEYRAIISHLPAPPFDESLAKLNPKLVSEWHPNKNAPLTPDLFTPFSHEKIWWQCSRGHEWKSEIANRAQGKGCLICAVATSGGRRRAAALRKFGSLVKTDPEVASTWNFEKNGELKPQDFPRKSNVVAWWKCSLGHEWQAMIAARTRGNGCPTCAKNSFGARTMMRAVSRTGSLLTKHPIIAASWDAAANIGISPEGIGPGSHKKVWWICPHGHSWQSSVRERVKGRTCPFCGCK